MNTFQKGRLGEQIACEYLNRKGFSILDRNYRWSGGELDIVALEDEQLVVIEVKRWDHYDTGELGRSIDYRKRRKIIATTRRYLATRKMSADLSVRFDVVLVRGNNQVARHIRGAFGETRTR